MSGVLDQAAMRRSRAAWVAMVALAVGVSLIAMHSALSRPGHAHDSGHAHALAAVVVGDDAPPSPACEGCASHTSMVMVCSVLLAAVAGGAVARMVRRLVARARVVRVAPPGASSWLRDATGALARVPDLHALQVMRC